MKLITLYLPEPYIEALDRLINERLYPNRAEAIRTAIRDLITDELWTRARNPKKTRNGKKGRKHGKRGRRIVNKA